MFIRSLVILYYFGPYVLGKGESSWVLLERRANDANVDAIGGWVFKQALEVLKAQAIVV
jgi:hypothetical protein